MANIIERKRKPLKSSGFKLYLRTKHKVVELYKSLLSEYLLNKNKKGKNDTRKTSL